MQKRQQNVIWECEFLNTQVKDGKCDILSAKWIISFPLSDQLEL